MTVVALRGFVQDINGRTEAERFLHLLVNQLPAMVAYWDTGLQCRFANEQYREWFGRSPAEMLGVTIQELLGADLFALNEPFIRGAISGKAQYFERTLIKPSGVTGQTLTRYIPDIDGSGRVEGMIVLVTDVSEFKETELMLKQANAAAETAREEAEAALNVKGEFLSNISHELRTPLTSIIASSELLARQSALNGDVAKEADRIRAAGSDLLRTVNDLLDFSKLEAGQVPINLAPVDPCSLGLGALDFFETQLLGKNLSHAFRESELPPALMLDHVRVRQVLLNLIGNAVKFTSHGGVSLLAEYDRSRRILRYTVTDTGPGIPQAYQPKLFQRFSQVNGPASRRPGGAGLGLAICKGLAEAMGGSVGFFSTVGEGSRFWLEIPSETAAPSARSLSNSGEATGRTDILQGVRLLVVDDHPANRELIRRIVEPLGVVVVAADSGRCAVALAEQEQFDIILMDVLMPDMDGPATAQLIRAGSGPSHSASIIEFTANGDRDIRSEWAGLFSDLLRKPFAVVDLLNLLVRHAPDRIVRHGPPVGEAARPV